MTSVSVIVPAYNEEKYIKKCVDSILNQTLKDIDIILIDDGSTDKTFEIMQEYSKKNKNVTAISLPHGGVGIARNKGLDSAKGEYIKFVDADDYLNPNSLELMYNKAKETDSDIVRCSYQTIIGPLKLGDFHNYEKSDNHIIDISKDKDFIVRETPSIGNKLIKKELFKNIRFGEGIKWEDLAIIPALMAKSNKIYFMNDALYNYRFNLSTTVLDYLRKVHNIDDNFKALELLKSRMPKEYDEQYKSLFIIHTLYRLDEASHWVMCPKSEKEELIKRFITILNELDSNWINNEMLNLCAVNKKSVAKTLKRIKKYAR